MIKSTQGQSTLVTGRLVRSIVLVAGLYSSLALAQSDSSTEITDFPVTVKDGDTYSSILSRELKSLDAWGEVAEYNKLASPDHLKPGDIIVIPAEVMRLRNYATVIYVKGEASHFDSATDSKKKVSKGDRIYSGDMIETDKDGFVSVSFNGGSSVNIQTESKMKINVLECVDLEDACEIDLESGKGELGLDVQSVGFSKPTVFNIKTPYATAAVRGTRFDFDINEGNILGVTEGTVEIFINGASNTVGVGKGVLAGEGRSINQLFDLSEAPELILRDDITRVSSEDIINWQPLDDVANYLIAFAPSESIADVLVSSSESNTFIKPELPVGELFVSARAVAANGLRGFTSKKKLTSVGVDEEAVAPSLDISIVDNEMQIIASGAASDEVEVKIGHALESLASGEFIVASQIHHLSGGETLTLPADRSVDWYLQSRNVLDPETVSPYGLLYFFEKTDE